MQSLAYKIFGMTLEEVEQTLANSDPGNLLRTRLWGYLVRSEAAIIAREVCRNVKRFRARPVSWKLHPKAAATVRRMVETNVNGKRWSTKFHDFASNVPDMPPPQGRFTMYDISKAHFAIVQASSVDIEIKKSGYNRLDLKDLDLVVVRDWVHRAALDYWYTEIGEALGMLRASRADLFAPHRVPSPRLPEPGFHAYRSRLKAIRDRQSNVEGSGSRNESAAFAEMCLFLSCLFCSSSLRR